MAAERTRKIPGPASARDAPVRGLEATKASGVLHQSDDPVPRLLTSFGTRLLRTLKPSLPPLAMVASAPVGDAEVMPGLGPVPLGRWQSATEER